MAYLDNSGVAKFTQLLKKKIRELIDGTPLYKVVRYSYTYSCAASGATTVTKKNLGITVPDGYTMGGYVAISTGSGGIVPRSWNPQSTPTGTTIALKNVLTSSVSNQTLMVDVLWLKSTNKE